MANKEIRTAMRIADIKQWEVAEKLGVREETFCRWLRRELPPEKADAIMSIIEEIKTEKGE